MVGLMPMIHLVGVSGGALEPARLLELVNSSVQTQNEMENK